MEPNYQSPGMLVARLDRTQLELYLQGALGRHPQGRPRAWCAVGARRLHPPRRPARALTAQLVDAATGGHLWAERYDRDLTDIFEVQDDVTHRIVDALKVTLSPAENARLSAGGTSSMDAYDYVLRGRELLLGKTKNRETFEQSTKLFMRALELDPNYPKAYAAMSMRTI